MPSEYPHLPNAPIVEAILDLRVRLEPGFDVGVLRTLHDTIAHDFPRLESQESFEGRFHFTGEDIVAQGRQRALHGFRMLSEDGRNIVQFRLDGFTFSRLRPYTRWDVFFADGWRLWELYREVAEPTGVRRLATRFINRLTCPPEFRLEEYFRAPPGVPDGIPDTFVSFLYRYVLAPVDDISASVTLATEPTTSSEEGTSVIFDIDCYVQRNLRADEDDTIRETFLKLRRMKNRIFFESLTPQALEAFK